METSLKRRDTARQPGDAEHENYDEENIAMTGVGEDRLISPCKRLKLTDTDTGADNSSRAPSCDGRAAVVVEAARERRDHRCSRALLPLDGNAESEKGSTVSCKSNCMQSLSDAIVTEGNAWIDSVTGHNGVNRRVAGVEEARETNAECDDRVTSAAAHTSQEHRRSVHPAAPPGSQTELPEGVCVGSGYNAVQPSAVHVSAADTAVLIPSPVITLVSPPERGTSQAAPAARRTDNDVTSHVINGDGDMITEGTTGVSLPSTMTSGAATLPESFNDPGFTLEKSAEKSALDGSRKDFLAMPVGEESRARFSQNVLHGREVESEVSGTCNSTQNTTQDSTFPEPCSEPHYNTPERLLDSDLLLFLPAEDDASLDGVNVPRLRPGPAPANTPCDGLCMDEGSASYPGQYFRDGLRLETAGWCPPARLALSGCSLDSGDVEVENIPRLVTHNNSAVSSDSDDLSDDDDDDEEEKEEFIINIIPPEMDALSVQRKREVEGKSTITFDGSQGLNGIQLSSTHFPGAETVHQQNGANRLGPTRSRTGAHRVPSHPSEQNLPFPHPRQQQQQPPLRHQGEPPPGAGLESDSDSEGEDLAYRDVNGQDKGGYGGAGGGRTSGDVPHIVKGTYKQVDGRPPSGLHRRQGYSSDVNLLCPEEMDHHRLTLQSYGSLGRGPEGSRLPYFPSVGSGSYLDLGSAIGQRFPVRHQNYPLQQGSAPHLSLNHLPVLPLQRSQSFAPAQFRGAGCSGSRQPRSSALPSQNSDGAPYFAPSTSDPYHGHISGPLQDQHHQQQYIRRQHVPHSLQQQQQFFPFPPHQQQTLDESQNDVLVNYGSIDGPVSNAVDPGQLPRNHLWSRRPASAAELQYFDMQEPPVSGNYRPSGARLEADNHRVEDVARAGGQLFPEPYYKVPRSLSQNRLWHYGTIDDLQRFAGSSQPFPAPAEAGLRTGEGGSRDGVRGRREVSPKPQSQAVYEQVPGLRQSLSVGSLPAQDNVQTFARSASRKTLQRLCSQGVEKAAGEEAALERTYTGAHGGEGEEHDSARKGSLSNHSSESHGSGSKGAKSRPQKQGEGDDVVAGTKASTGTSCMLSQAGLSGNQPLLGSFGEVNQGHFVHYPAFSNSLGVVPLAEQGPTTNPPHPQQQLHYHHNPPRLIFCQPGSQGSVGSHSQGSVGSHSQGSVGSHSQGCPSQDGHSQGSCSRSQGSLESQGRRSAASSSGPPQSSANSRGQGQGQGQLPRVPFDGRLPEGSKKRKVLETPGQVRLAAYLNCGLVTIHVIEGRYFSCSWKSVPSPYIKLSLIPEDRQRKLRLKSKPIGESHAPMFDEKFSLELQKTDEAKRLLVSFWHKDREWGCSEFLGCMSFGVKGVLRNKAVNGWYYLLTEDVGKKKHLEVSSKSKSSLRLKSHNIPRINRDVLGLEAVTVKLERGKNGFGFSVTDEIPVKVGRVDLGSPAEEAGLRVGDYVIMVNNQNVSRSTTSSVAKLIKKSGETLNLLVNRPHTPADSKPPQQPCLDPLPHPDDQSLWKRSEHIYESIPEESMVHDDEDNKENEMSVEPGMEVTTFYHPGLDLTCHTMEMSSIHQTFGHIKLPSSTPLPSKAGSVISALMTLEQKKGEMIHQLTSLELDFIDFMQCGISRYSRPLKHKIFSQIQHQVVFQNIEKLVNISEYHVQQIQENAPSVCTESDDDSQISDDKQFASAVAMIYASKVQMFCQAHEAYAEGLSEANRILSDMRQNEEFMHFIKEPPLEPGQPSISAFIFRPLQHIKELASVFHEIYNLTPKSSTDYATLKQVTNVLQESVRTISNLSNARVQSLTSLTSHTKSSSSGRNSCAASAVYSKDSGSESGQSSKQRMSNLKPSASLSTVRLVDREVLKLQDSLVFQQNVPVFQLCHEDRHIIFQGEVFYFHDKQWSKILMVLLSDLLLLCQPEKDGSLLVLSDPIMLLDICLIETHKKHSTELVIKTCPNSPCSGMPSTLRMVFRTPTPEDLCTWKHLLDHRVKALQVLPVIANKE